MYVVECLRHLDRLTCVTGCFWMGHKGNVDEGEIPKNRTAVVFVSAARCCIEQQCVLLQFSQLLRGVCVCGRL